MPIGLSKRKVDYIQCWRIFGKQAQIQWVRVQFDNVY